jgi:hypothetical protein
MKGGIPEVLIRRKPVPRHKIYDLYWLFAARRQAVYEARVAGLPAPWTNDSILQEFKFCNVFRAADRVSQYLIRRIAYAESKETTADKLFQIVAFRTFSNTSTWDDLNKHLGHAPRISDLESGAFERALDKIKGERGGLYTGAFILCANKAFGADEKHKNHAALFKHMFIEKNAANRIKGASSLEALVKFLASFPLMGPFMSYQTAIDLNYSDLLDFDEDDFTQAGPGALRGIKKAFTELGAYEPSDVIREMVETQEKEFSRLELKFGGLWGRRLHAIDCQGLFCELDKYCRQAAPQLPSNRSRIKTRFSPTSKSFEPFFPPKWGINQHVPNRPPVDVSATQRASTQLSLFSRSK